MPKQSWYPNFEPTIPYSVKEAFRRVLDFIYEQRDQRGALALYARGLEMEQIIDVVPVAVNGCSITIPRTGSYLVTGVFTIEVDDAGQLFSGILRLRGNTPQQAAVFMGASGTTVQMIQQWFVTQNLGDTLSLSIQKEGGGGTSNVLGVQTTISAIWSGND